MVFLGTRYARCLFRPYSAVPADGGANPPPDAQISSDGVRAEARSSMTGMLGDLSSAFVAARATVSSFLDLISLEARRAGVALMWMVILGLIAAICIAAAWLGLMAGLVMGSVSLGVSPLVAVIATAAINLVAGGLVIYIGIGKSRDLLFSATRRQVAGQSSVMPPAP